MQTLKFIFKNFLKGIFVGIGAIIPGVSGGTAAMLIGVFEDILESIANFFYHIRKSIILLFPIFLGACIGAYFISIPLKNFCAYFPFISKLIFCLLSLASTIFFAIINLKGITKKKFVIPMLMGTVCAATLSLVFLIFKFNFSELNFAKLFLTGFPLALALVLPAVSFSYMLLFFNIYEIFLNAVNTFDVIFLFPILSGILLGSFIFSKLLTRLINKHSLETYSFVFGFVLCATIDIFI